MELTPQLLTDEIDFRIAVRGYDRGEVDDFLERVAVAVGQLQSQLTKAVTRAKQAEARLADRASDAGATEESDTRPAASGESDTRPAASEEPTRRGVGAPPPAAPTATVPVDDDIDLNDELRRTLVLAQRTADMAIREAREEADGIRAGAEEDARRLRAEVEAEVAEARQAAQRQLVDDIRELEATRDVLRGDTAVLERYLGSERARVRETIQVLRRLVDEPERFRPSTPPELSEVSIPRELEAPAPSASQTDSDAGSDADASADGVDEAPTGADDTHQEDLSTQITEDAPETGRGDAEGDEGDVGESGAEVDAEADAVADAEVDAEVDVEVQPGPWPDAEAGTAPSGGAEDAGEGAKAADRAPRRPRDDAERLGQLFGAGEEPRDWRASGPERGDQGPHTQPVAAARFEEESDDAFLAELRRAMQDDEPLGPDADH